MSRVMLHHATFDTCSKAQAWGERLNPERYEVIDVVKSQQPGKEHRWQLRLRVLNGDDSARSDS